MNWILYAFSALLLFVIIYGAVRLAIDALLPKEETDFDVKKAELIYLRTLDVLTNDEIDEIMNQCEARSVQKLEQEKYERYVKLLDNLKEAGCITEEMYAEKIELLKMQFNEEAE